MADDVTVSSTATYPVAADDVGGGVLAQIVKLAYSADGSRVMLQVDANGMLVNIASLPLPALAATSTIQATQQTSLTSLDGKTPALGQQVAAASSPVVLTAAQITTLTPLATVALGAGSAVVGHVINDASSAVIGHVIVDATSTTAVTQATGTNLHVVVDSAPSTAVTGTVTANAGTNLNTSLLALEAGHLATIDTSTAKIPSQGQALAAASLPVVLTAAQLTTLTPLVTTATASNVDPQYAEASSSALSQTLSGQLRVTNEQTVWVVEVLNDILVELRTQNNILHSTLNCRDDLDDLRADSAAPLS